MSLVWGRTWLGVKLQEIVMNSQGQECLLRVNVSWDWIPLSVRAQTNCLTSLHLNFLICEMGTTTVSASVVWRGVHAVMFAE